MNNSSAPNIVLKGSAPKIPPLGTGVDCATWFGARHDNEDLVRANVAVRHPEHGRILSEFFRKWHSTVRL
jgi:hypothetical protein